MMLPEHGLTAIGDSPIPAGPIADSRPIPGRRLAVVARCLIPALLALCFVVSYGIDPLYTSNQNHHLLAGLAQAELGSLRFDWQANTVDPFPLFGTIVELTVRYGDPRLFYVYHMLLAATYFLALVGIALAVAPIRTPIRFSLFIASLFLVHSSLLSQWSITGLGIDLPRLLHTGVAQQQILGQYVQPSSFGVILIVSVLAYLRDLPLVATLLAVITPMVHASYLLAAGSLVAAYAADTLYRERRLRPALVISAAGAVILLPTALYSLLRFPAAPPPVHDEALRVLAHVRIPHHALPAVWFGWQALFQVALVAAALIAVWRTRLFLVLAIPAGIAVALTAVQLVSGSDFLALAFPWRVSALLVPISTVVLFARVIGALGDIGGAAPSASRRRLAIGVAVGLVGATIVGGAVTMQRNVDAFNQRQFLGAAHFLRDHASGSEAVLVRPSLDRFRTESLSPIVVDWKSIPYLDTEVLEWHHRYQTVSEFYETHFSCQRLDALATTYNVGWMVRRSKELPDDTVATCGILDKVYSDESYAVFRINRSGQTTPESAIARSP
jgi:hypothetical protein